MATIIEARGNGKRFVLLGSGYGAWKSERPNPVFGNLWPDADKGQTEMLCVCNRAGDIGWVSSKEVRVISVDGQPVADLFGPETESQDT